MNWKISRQSFVNLKLTRLLVATSTKNSLNSFVEKKYWANEKYPCRECLEIWGTSESWMMTWKTAFSISSINVTPQWMRQILKAKNVIIILYKRKDVFDILQRKNKLKSVDLTNVSLPQGSLVFVNQSLCS